MGKTKASDKDGMRIENLNVESLVPYARNAKTHDDAQIADIAGSIREFGFNNPVLIDKDGGIIAGHGRVLAARRLGMDTLPCIRLGHLTENQKRAYILADNRLAEKGGGWDNELLKIELESIDFAEFADFTMDSFGFDMAEIEKMIEPQCVAMEEQDGTSKKENKTTCPNCGASF